MSTVASISPLTQKITKMFMSETEEEEEEEIDFKQLHSQNFWIISLIILEQEK